MADRTFKTFKVGERYRINDPDSSDYNNIIEITEIVKDDLDLELFGKYIIVIKYVVVEGSHRGEINSFFVGSYFDANLESVI